MRENIPIFGKKTQTITKTFKNQKMEDDPDNFVIYGNALPALEEEEASAKKMKPVPIEEQVATDEQGRRRYVFVILK